ncbi:BMP family protein [Paenibacillus elgii]|uniref:BMP family protein n=1 Tax=Paenibacillus elgii TaxID=189691 RepID=UPI001953FCF4|nr:BMP family protein [Paenibacillus elgii]
MRKLLSKLALSSLAIMILIFSSGFSSAEAGNEHAKKQKKLKVALLLPGPANDGGFMESAYRGLMKAKEDFRLKATYVDNVPHDTAKIADELRKLAKKKPDMIIAHAGQSSEAVKLVSKEFPKIKFVNTQTNLTGDNLSSYQVKQEESAWLAGAAAGLLTKSNVVSHISGARVTPGFHGRAAFAGGLKYTNPNATFLTTFTGNQDDAALAKKVAQAQIAAGSDMIFTMLNVARSGVTEAARENGVFQFGNVRDYYADAPDVFIGSAISDAGFTVYGAIKDLAEGKWKPNTVVKIGLENPDAVRLALAPTVPQEVKDKIAEFTEKIKSGEIIVPSQYTGPEFEVK